MQQICQISGQSFDISDEEIQFFQKMNLPLPLIAPKYRKASVLAFRNERNLYRRTCDATKKSIISIYPPDAPYPVYEYSFWTSDQWTPPQLDYDPEKDFFEQYHELQKMTPRVNGFSPYNENSEYVSAAEKCKNCYMIFVSDRCEDCLYLDTSFGCRDCADLSYSHNCELCYESCDLKNCYHCRYSYLCENCSDVSFSFDMRGCRDCFLCFGLRNQQYCILNQPYSKEEYFQKMNEIDFTSFSVIETLKKKFFETIMPKKYEKILNCENSDGNFLVNCRNCHECFDVEAGEDCRRVTVGANGIKDVYDTHGIVDGSELIFQCVSVTEGYLCHNMVGCWTTKNSCYSEFLQGCSDCIGCISLKRRKYSILNKQYSKEEYEKIKGDICAKMGDRFGSPFPLWLTSFSYLECAAPDYVSLSKEEVEQMGWRYDTGKKRELFAGDLRSTEEIPDKTSEFTPEHLKKVFQCPVTGRPFKVIEQELQLLKKVGAPIPRRHFDQRFRDRIRFRQGKG